jgi:hypothetical protein
MSCRIAFCSGFIGHVTQMQENFAAKEYGKSWSWLFLALEQQTQHIRR